MSSVEPPPGGTETNGSPNTTVTEKSPFDEFSAKDRMFAAPRRRLMTVLAVAAVIFGLLACVLILAPHWLNLGKTPAARAKVGDCLSLFGKDGVAESRAVPCDLDEVVWQVASTNSGSADCETPAHLKFTEQAAGGSGDINLTLCLQEVLKKGHCYSSEKNTRVPGLELLLTEVSCSDLTAVSGVETRAEQTFKVVDKLEGTADAKACPAGSLGVVFTSPAVTYCTALERKL